MKSFHFTPNFLSNTFSLFPNQIFIKITNWKYIRTVLKIFFKKYQFWSQNYTNNFWTVNCFRIRLFNKYFDYLHRWLLWIRFFRKYFDYYVPIIWDFRLKMIRVLQCNLERESCVSGLPAVKRVEFGIFTPFQPFSPKFLLTLPPNSLPQSLSTLNFSPFLLFSRFHLLLPYLPISSRFSPLWWPPSPAATPTHTTVGLSHTYQSDDSLRYMLSGHPQIGSVILGFSDPQILPLRQGRSWMCQYLRRLEMKSVRIFVSLKENFELTVLLSSRRRYVLLVALLNLNFAWRKQVSALPLIWIFNFDKKP